MLDGHAELTMTVLMTPDKANFSGNVHGGTLLSISTKSPMPAPAVTPGSTSSPLGGPCSVPSASARGRAGHIPRLGQLHRHHVDGDRHQGGDRRHPLEDGTSHQQLLHHGRLGEDGKPVPVPPLNPKPRAAARASPRPTSAARSVVSWNTATASCVPVTSAPPCSKLQPGIDVVLPAGGHVARFVTKPYTMHGFPHIPFKDLP